MPQISELEFGRILHLGLNNLRLSIITEFQNVTPVCLRIEIMEDQMPIVVKKSFQITNRTIPGVGPLEILGVHSLNARMHGVATRLIIITRFKMVILKLITFGIATCSPNCVQIWKGRDWKMVFCRVRHKKYRDFFYVKPFYMRTKF